MRRYLILTLAISLALTVTPSIATAAVKAGATCSKIGQSSTISGKKYTCTKYGKKLLWNNGLAIEVSTPTPTPTPTVAGNVPTSLPKISLTWDGQIIIAVIPLSANLYLSPENVSSVTARIYDGGTKLSIHDSVRTVSSLTRTVTFKWNLSWFWSNFARYDNPIIIVSEFANAKGSGPSGSSQIKVPNLSPTPTVAPTPTLPNDLFPTHTVGTGLCDIQKNNQSPELYPVSSYVKVTKKYSTLWQKYDLAKPTSASAIDRAVIASFGNYIGQKRHSAADARISFQRNFPYEMTMTRLYGELVAVANLLSTGIDYPNFEKPVRLVVFQDWGWLKDEYISLGCSPDQASSMSNEGSASGGADGFLAYAVFDFSDKDSKGLLSFAEEEVDLRWLAGHEFFHLIQHQLLSPQRNFYTTNEKRLPGWLGEGGASLVGSLVKKYLGSKLFDLQGAPEAASNPISGGTTIQLENTDGAGARLIYDLGLLGCELLVSIVGFEKFVNIWRESGSGKKFSDAFQDATGIELKDFYLMFEEIRPIISAPRS